MKFLDYISEDDKKLTDADYARRRKPGRTYISRRLTYKNSMRIVHKVIDSEEHWSEAKLREETILRITPGERQQIIAKIYEDTKGIFVLTIQRFGEGSNKEHNFSFVGKEIETLKKFIDNLKYLDLSNPDKSRIEDEELEKKSRIEDEELEKIRKYLMKDKNLFIQMFQKNITEKDVVALAYRKEQLDIFKKLLNDPNFFEAQKTESNKSNHERVWQNFFERNKWIFGYGLNLVFNGPLEGKKLEGTVKGSDITGSGKRVDALLKTRGIISSLCLVEIKTHMTGLLKSRETSYRSGCWQVSDELNGGVSQIQKTSLKTIKNLREKIELKKEDGSPTGEEIFVYQPKTYLVIGNLSQFKEEHGVNTEKFSSFELFRRNLTNPEIITFDELYERAKFIVHNNEKASEPEIPPPPF